MLRFYPHTLFHIFGGESSHELQIVTLMNERKQQITHVSCTK